MGIFGSVQPVRWSQTHQATISAAEAWQVFGDTDRFNRRVGMGKVEFEEEPEASGEVTRRVRAEDGSRYTEEPFEWEEGRRFSVVRRFEGGPVLGYRWAMHFRPHDGGSAMELVADIYPRWPWVRPLIWLKQRLVLERTFRREVGRLLSQDRVHIPAPDEERNKANAARIAKATATLVGEGCPEALVAAVMDTIATETDLELLHMRPMVFADRLDATRGEVTRLFLLGTRAGFFEMRWSLICPLCRGPKAEVEDLSRLRTEAHCSSCNIGFDASYDRNVQVTFRPATHIRPLSPGFTCFGGPARTPHVHCQGLAEAGGELVLASAWPASLSSPATLRCPATKQHVLIEKLGRFRLTGEGFERLGDGSELVVVNALPDGHRFTLEDADESNFVLTAAEVMAMASFRDLLSEQTLAPDMAVALRPMTFLFTDLQGSTAMYEAVGDALAFGRVKAHFDVLMEALDEHRGELVKTIGDAVMATFEDPLDAMRCAVAMQRKVREETGLTLKIGLHRGRAMAVTLNDRLDFFGATVNRAARMEGLAHGGEIILSGTVANDPVITAWLDEMPFAARLESVQVRGVQETIEICRVKVMNDAKRTTEPA